MNVTWYSKNSPFCASNRRTAERRTNYESLQVKQTLPIESSWTWLAATKFSTMGKFLKGQSAMGHKLQCLPQGLISPHRSPHYWHLVLHCLSILYTSSIDREVRSRRDRQRAKRIFNRRNSSVEKGTLPLHRPFTWAHRLTFHFSAQVPHNKPSTDPVARNEFGLERYHISDCLRYSHRFISAEKF